MVIGGTLAILPDAGMDRQVMVIGLVITAPLVAILASGFGKDPHTINSPLVGRDAPLLRCASSMVVKPLD